jgi:hypothetical protein
MFPPPGTKVLQLDIDPSELGRNYPNAVSILGDAKAGLQRMIEMAPSKASEPRAQWLKHVQKIVADWRAENAAMRTSDAVPIRPERICKAISDVLPGNGVVVSDTGHAGIWTARMIELAQPTQRYVRTAGSLGWGLPGALGVKCALPDRLRLRRHPRDAPGRACGRHPRGDHDGKTGGGRRRDGHVRHRAASVDAERARFSFVSKELMPALRVALVVLAAALSSAAWAQSVRAADVRAY